MSSANIQETLREGVDAARRGDKLAARRLLQQVLIQDRDNEVALMWMASVVDTVEDRRAYLLRALQVNPNNDRAREALRRLGYEPPPPGTAPAANAPRQAASTSPSVDTDRRRRSSSGPSPFLIAAAVVGLVIIVIAALALTAPQTVAPTPAGGGAIALPSNTPLPQSSNTPVPTATVFGIVVTRNPNAQDVLPPTFTPTTTEVPTRTFTPTVTPIPAINYPALISDYQINNAQPSLYRINGQGEAERALGGGEGYADIALNPTGDMIAFMRIVAAPPVAEATLEQDAPTPTPIAQAVPQLFIAPIGRDGGAVGEAIQITSMIGSQMSRPTWSSDGRTIVFASNQDGDFDLYSVSVDGGEPVQLTLNNTLDTSPAFRPQSNMVAYVSDQDSPGFTDIYTYDLGTESIIRLTDGSGNLFDPAWSPDGERLAYISDSGGDGDVFVANARGQRPIQLTINDGGAEDRAPAWSPDGAYVAFASNRDGTNFQWYAVHVNSGALDRLNSSNREAQRLVFLP